MRLIFLTKYGNLAASSRLRAYEYRNKINISSYDVEVQPLLNNLYVKKLFNNKPVRFYYLIYFFIRRLVFLFKTKKNDVIVIHTELFPFLPPIFEWFLFKSNRKVYLDYDDAIFHRYDLSSNIIIKFFLSKKIKYLMKESDGVICGNKYLEKYAQDSGSQNTIILPTLIDINRYPASYPKISNKVFTVGWIGSPTTSVYLELMKEPLSKLGKLVQVRLYLVGAGVDFDIKFDNIEIISLPWTQENEVEALSNFDIGIMPLFNESWEKGKCAFKLIQYMGSFLPVIASNVGMNSEVVKNGINGYLASNSEEWFTALKKMYSAKKLRKEMGAEGRALVEEQFTIQSRMPDFIKFISGNKDFIDKLTPPKNLPLVSIMVITYNQSEFISDCLDSIVSQDYQNIEVIVADDGSTDKTIEILNNYALKYAGIVKIKSSKTNKGITVNSNLALSFCKGEYIAFTGGDDVFMPGKISRQIEWFLENDKRSLCGHNAMWIDENGKDLNKNSSEIMPVSEGNGPSGIIKYGPPFPSSSMMFKASKVPEYGFHPKINIISDWKFMIDIVSDSSAYGFIDGTFLKYRHHPKSVTNQMNMLEIFTKIFFDQVRTFIFSIFQFKGKYSFFWVTFFVLGFFRKIKKIIRYLWGSYERS